MKKIFLILLLLPCFINAQELRNRYADTTLKSVELLLHTTDGRTITLPNIQRGIFFNDSTFIARYPDSSRIWFQIIKPVQQSTTKFGLLAANQTLPATEQILTRAGIPIVRQAIYFAQNTNSNAIDTYLDDGYDVQINFNYKPTNDTVPFPTDTDFIRKQAIAFFEYYKGWATHIPFVSVENEWDNLGYHFGTVQDYLTELKIVCEEGQKRGFKISDAGITDGAIKKWSNGNFDATEFINGIKNIPIDYLNFHWYVSNNAVKDYDLRTVVSAYMIACNKNKIVTNEFGIRSNTIDLWKALINNLKNYVEYGVAYSGVSTGTDGKAITLQADYLSSLQ